MRRTTKRGRHHRNGLQQRRQRSFIAVGSHHYCAIDASKHLRCTGHDAHGAPSRCATSASPVQSTSQEAPEKPRRSRGNMYKGITPDHYGFRDEDDGVLFGLVYNAKTLASEATFVDAKTMETLSVATAPFRVPWPLHGEVFPRPPSSP